MTWHLFVVVALFIAGVFGLAYECGYHHGKQALARELLEKRERKDGES